MSIVKSISRNEQLVELFRQNSGAITLVIGRGGSLLFGYSLDDSKKYFEGLIDTNSLATIEKSFYREHSIAEVGLQRFLNSASISENGIEVYNLIGKLAAAGFIRHIINLNFDGALWEILQGGDNTREIWYYCTHNDYSSENARQYWDINGKFDKEKPPGTFFDDMTCGEKFSKEFVKSNMQPILKSNLFVFVGFDDWWHRSNPFLSFLTYLIPSSASIVRIDSDDHYTSFGKSIPRQQMAESLENIIETKNMANTYHLRLTDSEMAHNDVLRRYREVFANLLAVLANSSSLVKEPEPTSPGGLIASVRDIHSLLTTMAENSNKRVEHAEKISKELNDISRKLG